MGKLFNKMDKILFFLSIFMFGYGLFMILDASSMKSFIETGKDYYFFNKQLVIIIISVILSAIIFAIPTKRYKKYIIPTSIALTILLIYLIINGEVSNGAKSWIYIGPFGLQPSELAKLAIILFSGVYYKANARYLKTVSSCLLPLGVGAVFTGLTLLQPDGGTGIILFALTMLLFYASPATKELKMKITLILLTIIMCLIIIVPLFGKSLLSKTQLDRFNFINPCSRYEESTGYQVCNGYIAINNGKLFSVSPGNSRQKYLYLPEAHTDFIFPIIIEEFGLLSGVAIILIYMIIIYRILYQAKRTNNIGNALICYGVACYIFLHVSINLVGVLGLLPLTGVPLPFLSYGGSFALTLAVSLAIVQRISIETHNEEARRALGN